MTLSEIADRLTVGGDWASAAKDYEGADEHHQAAATIRAQAEQVRALSDCRCELEAVSLALGSGVRFMDPPDGGSVTIAEQVARMRISLHEAETKLKIATEALEAISKKNGSHFAVNDDPVAGALRSGLASQAAFATQALARIKEM